MNSEDIYIDCDGAVASIVFNRPRARNAVTQAMWRALPAMLAELAADTAVRVIVLRGVDSTAFAAGADIAEFESLYGTVEAVTQSSAAIDAALATLEALPKPTIAVIRGICVGGGVSLATACDLRFADASARFAVTPAKLGLSYSLADTRRLAALVGAAGAKDLLFSGRMIEAAEAHAMGLVDRIIPAERFLESVAIYVRSLVALAPGSHVATKATLALLREGVDDESPAAKKIFLDRFASADFHEGYAAFLEKRAPKY